MYQHIFIFWQQPAVTDTRLPAQITPCVVNKDRGTVSKDGGMVTKDVGTPTHKEEVE